MNRYRNPLAARQKKPKKVRRSSQLPLLDRTALALLFLFLLTEVLGGAIRYYAVQFHIPWLPYLPHLLLGLSLVPMFFLYLASEGVTFTYLAVFVLVGTGAAYGIFNLDSASQVEFGLWVLVAFLFGIVVLPAIIHGWRKLSPYAFFLWVLAAVGVFINFFYSWPWVGLEYQVGTTSVQASRLWDTGGLNIARLPGFSRASFDVAVQILILALFLRETLSKRWRIAVWILSGVAIALTTSKTPIATYLLFCGMWLFYRGTIRPSWRLIPAFLASFDILLPFSMLLIRLDWIENIRSGLWVALALSFVDRLRIGWPDWIRMIFERGNPLLGRGLGGIGTAQQYFEPALYSPGDNIAVYLYGAFGLLGLALLLIYGWRATHSDTEGPAGRFFFFCACLVLLEGVTANVLEGSFMAMAFGASLRYVQELPAGSASLGTAGGLSEHARARLRQTAGHLRTSGSRPARV